MPRRSENLRRLHALGKRARLDHESLRSFCGVASLTELTDAQLDEACRRLQREVPDRPYKDRPRTRRAARGAIALVTAGQRRALESTVRGALADGFSREAVVRVLARHLPQLDELTSAHVIRTGTFSRTAASRAITQLTQMRKHRNPGWRKDHMTQPPPADSAFCTQHSAFSPEGVRG